MENKNLNLIYFSPTNTTKKVLDAIANGVNSQKVNKIDLIKENNVKKQNFSDDDFVIIGVPVYSGRIPITVINRLKNFKAINTKAVLVVVYGNRQYGDALLELKNLAVELGFLPIAAAAFIGEHSFSSSKYPIANGRPNLTDMKFAEDFGERIKTKFGMKYSEIKVPGNYPYIERLDKFILKPKIDLELCKRCGLCQEVCSVYAISIFDDKIEIDEKLCIYCHACVKICPQNAITIDDKRIIGFSKILHEKCKQPKEPEIFL
ncbi:MAG: 4Fe-4S binding protein [Candidatus Cloacimonetes bacterium]|nr:4Fe-4S binding protein [Candidatus Cloacimonadota bacterium]